MLTTITDPQQRALRRGVTAIKLTVLASALASALAMLFVPGHRVIVMGLIAVTCIVLWMAIPTPSDEPS